MAGVSVFPVLKVSAGASRCQCR